MGRGRAPAQFPLGDEVEVIRRDEGFRGSLYEARIVRRMTRYRQFEIEYETRKSEADPTKNRRGIVRTVNVRPRPRTARRSSFEVGEKVDAFYNDGWWIGEISRVLEGGKRYAVRFAGGNRGRKEVECGLDEIRVHADWINGQWIMPKKPAKSQVTIQERQCGSGPDAITRMLHSISVAHQSQDLVQSSTFSGGADASAQGNDNGVASDEQCQRPPAIGLTGEKRQKRERNEVTPVKIVGTKRTKTGGISHSSVVQAAPQQCTSGRSRLISAATSSTSTPYTDSRGDVMQTFWKETESFCVAPQSQASLRPCPGLKEALNHMDFSSYPSLGNDPTAIRKKVEEIVDSVRCLAQPDGESRGDFSNKEVAEKPHRISGMQSAFLSTDVARQCAANSSTLVDLIALEAVATEDLCNAAVTVAQRVSIISSELERRARGGVLGSSADHKRLEVNEEEADNLKQQVEKLEKRVKLAEEEKANVALLLEAEKATKEVIKRDLALTSKRLETALEELEKVRAERHDSLALSKDLVGMVSEKAAAISELEEEVEKLKNASDQRDITKLSADEVKHALRSTPTWGQLTQSAYQRGIKAGIGLLRAKNEALWSQIDFSGVSFFVDPSREQYSIGANAISVEDELSDDEWEGDADDGHDNATTLSGDEKET